MKNNKHVIDHSPLVPGIWVPFNGFSFNDWYDIQKKDGEVIQSVKPNNSSFFSPTTTSHILNTDVAKIRLKPDSELPPFSRTGSRRLFDHVRKHGLHYPAYVRTENVFVYQEDLEDGEYLFPMSYSAHRDLKTKSGTTLIVGEAELRNSPSPITVFMNNGGGIWWYDDEEMLTPEVMAERLDILARTSEKSAHKQLIVAHIREHYGNLPANVIQGFAGALTRQGLVDIVGGLMRVTEGTFIQAVNGVAESHLKQLDSIMKKNPDVEEYRQQHAQLTALVNHHAGV